MGEDRKGLAISTVSKAGAYLRRVFEEQDYDKIVLEEKSYLDFVSEADKKVEEIIISGIRSHFPKDNIISEESAEIGSEEKTDFHWIIDPLDGTHNFLSGFREWGVLLALQRAAEIIYGLCYFPMLGQFFIVEKGKGAFCNGERIRVSKADNLRGQMFCSDGILRKKSQEILGDIEKFCGAGCRLRVYGSSPYAFTRVALGQALVATNRYGKPWDIAAPALLVEEAGGKVTDEKGNPWSVNSENLIATNGLVHDKALLLFGYNGPYEMLPYYMKIMGK